MQVFFYNLTMFILYDFLLLVLFSVLFMGAYFSIERIIAIKSLRKLFVGNVFSSVLEGAIYGVVILLLELMMTAIFSEVGIAFYFISFLVMISMKKIRVASYALVPSMLFVFITGDITSNTFMLTSIIFVFAMLTIILEFSIKKINFQLILYPIITVLAFMALLISVYVFGRSTEENIGYIFYTIIGTILVQFLAVYALRTSASANVLHKSVNFSYSSFYRASFVEEVVGAYIKENKPEKAIYGLFKLNIQDRWDKKTKKEVIESALDNIKESFPEKSILFHIEDGRYGFFLPWDSAIDVPNAIQENTLDRRSSTNTLIPLTLLLNKASKEMQLSTGDTLSINVKAGISIYGVQSNSLAELHRNATFASQYIIKNKRNQFNIFDPSEYTSRVKDVKQLKELEELIELNDIELKEVPLLDKNNKLKLTIIVPRQKSDDGYVGTLMEYIGSAGMVGVFNRFIAAESIKMIGDVTKKIVIPHEWNYFGEDFNFEMFINKIELMNIDIKQIVMNFDASSIDNDSIIINNIAQLKKRGLGISITNVSENNYEKIKSVNPDYIMVDDASSFIAKTKALICNVNIIDEKTLLSAYESKVDLFGGTWFNNELDENTENTNIINTIKKLKGENYV